MTRNFLLLLCGCVAFGATFAVVRYSKRTAPSVNTPGEDALAGAKGALPPAGQAPGGMVWSSGRRVRDG